VAPDDLVQPSFVLLGALAADDGADLDRARVIQALGVVFHALFLLREVDGQVRPFIPERTTTASVRLRPAGRAP
jgi:hypothetical protein